MAATTETVMQQYIGTKIIKSKPMSYGLWVRHKSNDKEAISEGDNKDGYFVEYEDGYQSWSPKEAFESAYRPTSGMPFGLAIEAMKKGLKVCRAGWNGKGMWLGYCDNWNGNVKPDNEQFRLLPFIYMRTAQSDIVPWLASQTDMIADDWMIVE